MKPQELPETNINGLVTVSDFYPEQHQSMRYAPASYVSGLNQAQISHQIQFYPPASGYREGGFRVYVDAEHLQAARQLCISIEFSVK
jgi:hypothetical protein